MTKAVVGIALVSGVLVLLTSTIWFEIVSVIAIGGALLLVLFRPSFARREVENQGLIQLEERAREAEALREKNSELQEEAHTLRSEISRKDEVIEEIYKNYQVFVHTLPVVEELTQLISTKSENSTVEVTDSIFTITDTSKEVGENIRKLLTKLFKGEKSLDAVVRDLSNQIEGIHTLVNNFKAISKSYHKDMNVIEETVQGIEKFTRSITDLADRTNLLAINASIEAARVGEHGKGFAVIASDVQELSRSSKQLAEQINETIQETAHTVDNSFSTQSENIENAIIAMEESQKTLEQISSVLAEQVYAVETSVEEAEKLSGSVTEKLNNVIHSEQFQDINRQILEHLIAILHDCRDINEKTFSEQDLGLDIDHQQLIEQIKKSASRHFTSREEFEAIGMQMEETQDPENVSSETEKDEEFKGDITLF